MNNDMLGFQLPQWGAQGNNFSFGPEPMNMPAWDVPSIDSGSTAGTGAGMPQTGGYQPLEFGMNIPSFQLGLTGLGALGNLWGSYQSNKLARDSFEFQKGFAEKNYANQLKSYNTALTDRATTRGFVQGDSAQQTQQYINDNKL